MFGMNPAQFGGQGQHLGHQGQPDQGQGQQGQEDEDEEDGNEEATEGYRSSPEDDPESSRDQFPPQYHTT